MTIHTINNNAVNIGKVILWQYDKAWHLILTIKYLTDLYKYAIVDFWNYWNNSVLSIENCDNFGLSVWGIFLGVPRPTVTITDKTGTHTRTIDNSSYKKLLHGAFFLMNANCSLEDIAKYLSIVFDTDRTHFDEKTGTTVKNCGVTLADNRDMSITYSKSEYFNEMSLDQQAIYSQVTDVLPFPIGIKTNEPVSEWVFGFSGQENFESSWHSPSILNIGDIVSDTFGLHRGSMAYDEAVPFDGWDAFNYKVIKDMTYEAVWGGPLVAKECFEKTFEGNPFIGSFCEGDDLFIDQIPEFSAGSSYKAGDYFIYNYADPGDDKWHWKPNVWQAVKDVDSEVSYSFYNLIRGTDPYVVRSPIRALERIYGEKPYSQMVYHGGDLILHNGKLYVFMDGIAGWIYQKIAHSYMPWTKTTFICDSTQRMSEAQGYAYVTFVLPDGSIVKRYNGISNVSVSAEDLKAQILEGSKNVIVESDGKMSVSLDRAAAAEGKTIYGTATFGDIVRWLGSEE